MTRGPSSDSSKLIVIRGPSGAGKSTVARAIAATSKRPTAVVHRDDYTAGVPVADVETPGL